MKRFLLFIGSMCYPNGWNDFVGDYDSIDEAKEGITMKRHRREWYQIVDTNTKTIIEEN